MADQGPASPDRDTFSRVPIEVTVAVGTARPAIRDLLDFQPETVLRLDRRINDPVELYIGDRLIARGELQEIEGDEAGALAVRITEIASGPDDG
jgi:flagellar motor switch protein FliN/FliY